MVSSGNLKFGINFSLLQLSILFVKAQSNLGQTWNVSFKIFVG